MASSRISLTGLVTPTVAGGALALGLLASFACASTRVRSDEAATTTVVSEQPVLRGTVTFRERMALPPNARLVVTLSDVSRQDVAATAIAETTFVVGTQQVPIMFVLPYDSARIDPSHRYAVRATILTGGQLMFSTDSAYHVITMGSPAEVEVHLVRASGGTVQTPPALQGTSWRLEEIDGRPVLDQVEATLEFLDSARVAGGASCNRFFGSVQISGDSITFGQMGATQMACDDEVTRQETAYLRALEDAERFERNDTTLRIYSRGMERPLRFRRTG